MKRGAVVVMAMGLAACSQASLQTKLDAAEAKNRDLMSQLANAKSTRFKANHYCRSSKVNSVLATRHCTFTLEPIAPYVRDPGNLFPPN